MTSNIIDTTTKDFIAEIERGFWAEKGLNLVGAFAKLYPKFINEKITMTSSSFKMLDLEGDVNPDAHECYDDDEPCVYCESDEEDTERQKLKYSKKNPTKETKEVLKLLSKDENQRVRLFMKSGLALSEKLSKLGFLIIAQNTYQLGAATCIQRAVFAHKDQPIFFYYKANPSGTNDGAFWICGTESLVDKYKNCEEIKSSYPVHVVPYKAKSIPKGAECTMIGVNQYGGLELYTLNKVVCDLEENLLECSYPNVNVEKINSFFTTENPQGKLLLFHGIPGSGKTTYIRHLLSNVYDGRVVFVNADIFGKLTSASFLPFAIQNLQRTVLLIEDAEQLLVSRGADHESRSSSVADLLNYTDGLLGDALNLKVIATFNTSISQIDAALLRKGRLFHKEEFSTLTKTQAERLYIKLTGNAIGLEKDEYSLAEVYGLIPE